MLGTGEPEVPKEGWRTSENPRLNSGRFSASLLLLGRTISRRRRRLQAADIQKGICRQLNFPLSAVSRLSAFRASDGPRNAFLCLLRC